MAIPLLIRVDQTTLRQTVTQGETAHSQSFDIWPDCIEGDCPTITQTDSLPDGVVGTPYVGTLAATGGLTPYQTWTIISGALPDGLSLSSYIITGTPSVAGAFTFTVRVKDSIGCTGDRSYIIIICPGAFSWVKTLPAGTACVAYSGSVVASGGTAPYTYALYEGHTLPAGLTLNADGTITGTPLCPATGIAKAFIVVATDANGCTYQEACLITVNAPTITLDDDFTDGTVGTAYSADVAASGSTGPYTYAVTAGAVPAGLSLSSAGVLSGTPTTAETAEFTITATDSCGCTGERAYEVNIASGDLPDLYKIAFTMNGFGPGVNDCSGTPSTVVPYEHLASEGATYVWTHTESGLTSRISANGSGSWKFERIGGPYGTHTIIGTGATPHQATWPDGTCLGSVAFSERIVDLVVTEPP